MSQILKEFYVREINLEIGSFFDSGWTLKIGDHINGFREDKTWCFDSVTEMEAALNKYLERLPPLTENDLRYMEK